MGKIYCLMGKSASGKDTIFRELLKRDELGLKKIVPYTTRPVRAGEKSGEQYYFTDEEGLKRLEAEGRVIEKRFYKTVHGIWYYFTVDDDNVDLESADHLLIGTPAACIALRDFYGEEAVLPIYIELDDGERLKRALSRELRQKQPKYAEMCRRYLADEEDFSEENLMKAGIEKRFYNDDLDVCIERIAEYIHGYKGKSDNSGSATHTR
ncbi:MAG: guanylate kinase [Lachnospiraceae bacterium]|nr:guanylate kinase [Lachnospiraceae bacterium]